MLSACALLLTPQALATGMDCTKAASPVEKTLCANTDLYGLDAQMGSTYRELIDAIPQAQPELRKAQRIWLKTRDQCTENIECLEQSYRKRLQSLQAQRNVAVAYKPVLEDLRQSIQAASHGDAEFPLEKVLDALTIKTGTSTFSDVADDDSSSDETHFPKTIPKGVTQDEWQALSASKIEAAGESGNSSYTLMDLDGDGLRDLVIDTYTGGTGLFSYVETYRRTGEVFVRRTAVFDPETSSGSALFSINGRGANQSVDWIKVRGNVYAAYRNSYYGEDHLYLLNPLKLNDVVPTVVVNYRYQLSIPKTQKDEDSGATTTLSPALHNTLTQALSNVSKTEAKDIGDQRQPLCPIPPSGEGEGEGEGEGAYYGFGPGHYTFEIVGDTSVVIGNECFIGRMMDWFGGYSAKHGLSAQLVLRKPDFEGVERSYQVNGRRRMTETSISIGKVEGDN